MLVAEGAVDIAAEPSLALWDMVPLAVIVEEAGGVFSDLDGNLGPFGKSGISANRSLHAQFLESIKIESIKSGGN
jgi:histidinol-phosphatase